MAALLPTILSDDEDDVNEAPLQGTKNGRKNTKKNKKSLSESASSKKSSDIVADDDDIEDEEDVSGDEMDGDFEFGGLLVSESTEILVVCSARTFHCSLMNHL